MISSGLAELKIGYIQSERIRTEYEEFTEAESQLQMEYQKVQVEYEKMLLQLDSLNKDYEVKRLMALDKGESIKQQIIQMERAIQVYQAEKVGPQGEIYKIHDQLMAPVYAKIDEAIQRVGKQEGYDYIFNVVSGGIISPAPRDP